MRHGKGFYYEAIQQCENRRVYANSESQGKQREQSKPRAAAQVTGGELQVAAKLLHEHQGAPAGISGGGMHVHNG